MKNRYNSTLKKVIEGAPAGSNSTANIVNNEENSENNNKEQVKKRGRQPKN